MSRYFSKSHDPIVMTLLPPGEECNLDFSPKSCAYPTLVTIDPLEVEIISILLYKDSNCPTLFCTFTIDNSLFLTTVKKKMYCVSLFPVKDFLIYNSNCFRFWKDITICLVQLTFMIFYLSHGDVTVWHRPALLNTDNI